MRIGLGRGFFVLALGLMVGTGCEKSPAPPAMAAAPPPSARPTTRDLIEGARTDMPITAAPLSIKVPPSWKAELVDGVSILEGPSPSGDAEITVSTLPGMSSQRIELMVNGAIADAAKHPGRVEVRDLHGIDGLRTLERITYSAPTTQPTTAPAQAVAVAGDPVTDVGADAGNGPKVSWSRLVFVPFQDSFLPCSFSVSVMTPEEFNQDQTFLQSVLDSAQIRQMEDLQ
jgi:hypothetical protein